MTGALVVGMGLPGSGKSSVFKALADLLIREGREVFLSTEPEEEEWPAAVTHRDQVGHIGALTWFRTQRVPGLYEAYAQRNTGKLSLVDSYYDKLVHEYFDLQGFEWLMKHDDPYRPPYKKIIEIDRRQLPDADCVVTFVVERGRWESLVLGRGRTLDRSASLLNNYHTQDTFLTVAGDYCQERAIPHIRFENNQADKLESAKALREQLQTAGILK